MSFRDNSTGMTTIAYECVRCRYQFQGQEIEFRGGEIKCPQCGYRVIRKVKAPIVRRVKAI